MGRGSHRGTGGSSGEMSDGHCLIMLITFMVFPFACYGLAYLVARVFG